MAALPRHLSSHIGEVSPAGVGELRVRLAEQLVAEYGEYEDDETEDDAKIDQSAHCLEYDAE
mgnify:FL=1